MFNAFKEVKEKNQNMSKKKEYQKSLKNKSTYRMKNIIVDISILLKWPIYLINYNQISKRLFNETLYSNFEMYVDDYMDKNT